ncbi:hypothetical protein EV360DRAFT_26852, partial [Lentinula raphanica]
FGCNELESDHHLFVKCPAFDSFRSESSSSIISETNAILSNSEAINPSERDDLIQRANILLTDAELWPSGHTKFYLGIIPPSRVSNPSKTVEAVQTRARILSNWHSAIIHLTG